MKIKKRVKFRIISVLMCILVLLPQAAVLAGSEEDNARKKDKGDKDYGDIYTGIQIDGNFDDWLAVEKHEANDAYGVFDTVAAVWDDGNLYLCIREKRASGIIIKWDYLTTVESFYLLTNNGDKYPLKFYEVDSRNYVFAVEGINGSTGTGRYNSDTGCFEWEMVIPTSELGINVTEISMYAYKLFFWNRDKQIFEGLTDISGTSEKEPENKEEDVTDGSSKIVIDGHFEDWDNIPKTNVFYDKSIKHQLGVFSDGSYLYIYLKCNNFYMEQFPGYMTITVNGKYLVNAVILSQNWDDYYFYGRNTGMHVLQAEDFFGGDIGYGAANINALHFPGDMVEIAINLKELAKRLNLSSEQNGEMTIREVAVSFPTLGLQSAVTAGTSTGPVLGIVLCTSLTGLFLWKRKYF